MKKKVLTGIALGGTLALALAVDYGRYFCSNCQMPMHPVDVRSFVSVFVNNDVALWRAKDTFSICDGKQCIQYITANQGTVWSVKLKYPDPKLGYRRSGTSVSGSSGPSSPRAGSYLPYYGSGYLPRGVVTVGPLSANCILTFGRFGC